MTYALAIVTVLALAGIDQMVKYLTVANMEMYAKIPVINGVFELYHVRNEGMSWGMFEGGRWVFVLLTLAVMIALVIYFVRLPQTNQTRLLRIVLSVLFAGALGNWIDRVLHGYVVDMFHFYWFEFPIFNVADIFVVCATIMLCLLILFPKQFQTEFLFEKSEKKSASKKGA